MNKHSVLRLASKIVTLLILSGSLLVITGHINVNRQAQQSVTFLPVEVHQLPVVDGRVPVELSCLDAELSSPRSIEKLSCTLKNSTSRSINAASIEITVNIERGGKILELQDYYTLDSYLHPDFAEDHPNSLLPPGAQHPINELPSNYSDGVLKSISVGVDYVDFGDDKPLGPNRKGSQIIAAIRNGASKYKTWLQDKYTRNGKNIDDLVRLLDTAVPAQEIGATTANEQSGADMFRKYLLRDFKNHGADRIAKHFK